MTNVYVGSLVNIVAISAISVIDGSEGCFGMRDIDDLKAHCLQFGKHNDKGPFRVSIVPQEARLSGSYNTVNIMLQPLYKRAWALQELLLPSENN